MKEYKKNKRYYYFRKQKRIGGVALGVGVLAAILLDGGLAVAIIMALLGLYLIFTKDMAIVDDYFFEVNQKIEREHEDEL